MTSDVDEFEFEARVRAQHHHQHQQQQRLRTLPVGVSTGSTAGSPDAMHSALLPTPVSGGGVRLQHPGAGLPLPSMAMHEVGYGREDEYRDREREEMGGGVRGGRIAMPPPHPHMNTQLVIPNNISGNADRGSISPGES